MKTLKQIEKAYRLKHNITCTADKYKKIKLSNGGYTLVDTKDYEFLKQWNWYKCLGYVHRMDYKNRKVIIMHRVIMNTPNNKDTDHINMNGLDNRRKNLRIASRSQNSMNKLKQKNNTSGYKGVLLVKALSKYPKKWVAKIQKDYKVYHLGYFKTAKEASLAYGRKAKELFGEFNPTKAQDIFNDHYDIISNNAGM